MNIRNRPGNCGGANRELSRGIVRDRCYPAVVCSGRGAKCYSCGIALACIGRDVRYDCRAGDSRILRVNYRYCLVAGGCVAMNIRNRPGDRRRSDRELHRCVVRDRCYSAVVCSGRGAKSYSCGIALACIGRDVRCVCRARDSRVLRVNYSDSLVAGAVLP